MADENKNFWMSLPGILTGIAAVLTALTGLFLALSGNGPPETRNPPSVTLPKEATASGQMQAATKSPDSLFVLTARIDDPDGFTYVRSKASASGAIVAKVVDGEQFSTYIQSGNWW